MCYIRGCFRTPRVTVFASGSHYHRYGHLILIFLVVVRMGSEMHFYSSTLKCSGHFYAIFAIIRVLHGFSPENAVRATFYTLHGL